MAAIATGSCTANERLPQTGFICIEFPPDQASRIDGIVDTYASEHDFDVSTKDWDTADGSVDRTWHIHGRGLATFISSAMISGSPDDFGNRDTTYSTTRFQANVAATNQDAIPLMDDMLSSLADSAISSGAEVMTGSPDIGCSI